MSRELHVIAEDLVCFDDGVVLCVAPAYLFACVLCLEFQSAALSPSCFDDSVPLCIAILIGLSCRAQDLIPFSPPVWVIVAVPLDFACLLVGGS